MTKTETRFYQVHCWVACHPQVHKLNKLLNFIPPITHNHISKKRYYRQDSKEHIAANPVSLIRHLDYSKVAGSLAV